MINFLKRLFRFRKKNQNKVEDNGTKQHSLTKKLLLVVIFSAILTPFIRVKAAWSPLASLGHAVVAALIYIILLIPVLIGGAVAKISSVFMSHTLSPNFFPIKFTQLYQGGAPTFVGTGWAISRDLSYMIIVIALIAAGLGIALRIFEAQKILASIIIAALIIPFTPLICGLIIDPANILTNTFLQSGATTNITSLTEIVNTFGNMMVTQTMNEGPSGAAENIGSFAAGKLLNGLVYIFTVFMIAIAMFLYGAVFIVRGIALFFLVIFSPLAVAAYIFPQTKRWFSQWFVQLTGWAFVAPVAVFFLYLTGEMIHTLYVGAEATNLGLGNLAYFMIPPLTMYAGLAAISAVGPAGAKATVGIVKKQGGALLGGGLKWGKEKFASSKFGKNIAEGMQKAGEEDKELSEVVAGKSGLAKLLTTGGWALKRGYHKALNVGGSKLAATGYGVTEAQKKEAEQLVNTTFGNANGNPNEAVSLLKSEAMANPAVASALYDKLEKGGNLDTLRKNPALLHRVGEVLATKNPKKAISTLTPLMLKDKKLAGSMGPEFKKLLTEKGYDSDKEISDLRKKASQAYDKIVHTPGQRVQIQDIINQETGIDRIREDMKRTDLSKKQIKMLHDSGIKDIDSFVKGINNTKNEIRKTKTYTTYIEDVKKKERGEEPTEEIYFNTVDKNGIKSIQAKHIKDGEVPKDILKNDDVIKGLITEGKSSAMKAAADYVGEDYAVKVADKFNSMDVKEKADAIRKNPGLVYMFIQPGSPYFGLGKDDKGKTITNAEDAKKFIERISKEKSKIEIAHG